MIRFFHMGFFTQFVQIYVTFIHDSYIHIFTSDCRFMIHVLFMIHLLLFKLWALFIQLRFFPHVVLYIFTCSFYSSVIPLLRFLSFFIFLSLCDVYIQLRSVQFNVVSFSHTIHQPSHVILRHDSFILMWFSHMMPSPSRLILPRDFF